MQGKPWAGRCFFGPEDMEGVGYPSSLARADRRSTTHFTHRRYPALRTN